MTPIDRTDNRSVGGIDARERRNIRFEDTTAAEERRTSILWRNVLWNVCGVGYDWKAYATCLPSIFCRTPSLLPDVMSILITADFYFFV